VGVAMRAPCPTDNRKDLVALVGRERKATPRSTALRPYFFRQRWPCAMNSPAAYRPQTGETDR